MSDFKGVATTINRITLQHSDGSTERVSVKIGLDGLQVLGSDGRAMRNYELSHISRWQTRGTSLILYTKTPTDVEERQTSLSGDENSIRNVLDTLTCCCMQLVELLQTKKTESSQETANNLHALVAGNGKKKTSLPSADEVEYWKSPDKAGWLQSQGEVLKSWRKRWFVLKQGYLFRFMDARVSESVKPRGVVDLSKVQDVKPGPGRNNHTIQIKTASGGAVSYIADSETEVVEWISAIEGAISRIVKHAAGMEDEPAPAARKASSSSKASTSSANGSQPVSAWMQQLERNFDNLSATGNASGSRSGGGGGGGGGGTSSSRHGGEGGAGSSGPALINVVGYETIGGAGGGYSGAASSSGYGGAAGGASSAYGPIPGANSLPSANGGISDTMLNYGGASLVNSSHHSASQYGGGSSDLYRSSAPASQHDPYALARSNSQQQAQQQQQHHGYSPSGTAASPYGQQQSGASHVYSQQPAYSTPAAAAGYAAASQQPVQASSPAAYYAQPTQQPQQAQQFAQPQQQPQQQQQTQQQYAQPQAYGGGSLMDQVPQQQPAYPYFQHQATAPQQPPVTAQWQVHYAPDGRPYFYHSSSGTTTWDAPAGIVV